MYRAGRAPGKADTVRKLAPDPEPREKGRRMRYLLVATALTLSGACTFNGCASQRDGGKPVAKKAAPPSGPVFYDSKGNRVEGATTSTVTPSLVVPTGKPRTDSPLGTNLGTVDYSSRDWINQITNIRDARYSTTGNNKCR